MTQWEYTTRILFERIDPVNILDELGADGWELVSAYPFDEYVRFVFKCPVEKETK
jgi:hypothetical protein